MGEIVVVTGASGYIASWVVKLLLEAGHEVRATVRSRARRESVSHLEAMARPGGAKLQLFEADLLERGSFAEAIQGAQVVVHVASPFVPRKVRDPKRALVDPALEGTRNVLESVNETPTVRRVVLTSSIAALYGDAAELPRLPGGRATEADWNTTSSVRHNPYPYSKTVAERAAWQMAEAQTRWTLATVLPGFVVGPALSPRIDGTSTDLVLQMLDGRLASGVPDLRLAMVDVRDVAKAHLLAVQRPEAQGRFIVASESLGFGDLAALLRARFPGHTKIARGVLPNLMLYCAAPFLGFSWKYLRLNLGFDVRVDATRSREILGLHYAPVREALFAQAEQLLTRRG